MNALLYANGFWSFVEDDDGECPYDDFRIVNVPESVEDIDAYLCQLHDEEEEAFCRVMNAFASACTRSTT